MSYFDRIETSFVDNGQIDAAGRLRTSSLSTILEGKFYDHDNSILVDEVISGSASSTFNTDATYDMEVGNTTGDRIIRQTKKYAQYQPGKSQRVLMTGVLNSNPTTGIRSRIGYFDDKNDKSVGLLNGNGLFFQLDGTELSVNLRISDLSLNQSDTTIVQSNWNLDKLDGTGVSGQTIDPTKSQVFVIDFLWLGVGRIRFGFILGGEIIYCHEFSNDNTLTTTYMNTPSLPIRYEIENTGGVTNSSILKQICYSVMSEGGYESLDKVISVDRGISPLTVGTTLLPAVAIRLRDNTRSTLEPLGINGSNLSTNRDIRMGLYLNPTLTGGTWDSVNGSVAEVNTTATSMDITNSILLYSSYLVSQSNPNIELNNQLNLYKDIAGNSDIIALAFQTTGATSDVIGGINFREIF